MDFDWYVIMKIFTNLGSWKELFSKLQFFDTETWEDREIETYH